jgi:hypothetical protein
LRAKEIRVSPVFQDFPVTPAMPAHREHKVSLVSLDYPVTPATLVTLERQALPDQPAPLV